VLERASSVLAPLLRSDMRFPLCCAPRSVLRTRAKLKKPGGIKDESVLVVSSSGLRAMKSVLHLLE
jgi:hypothetical protein